LATRLDPQDAKAVLSVLVNLNRTVSLPIRSAGERLALAGIGPDRTRLEIWAEPGITRNIHQPSASPIRFYGAAIGVMINFCPDYAIRFNLDGEPVEVLSAAYRGDALSVSIRGKPVPPGALAVIFPSYETDAECPERG
jgi:hypothetical protein